MWDIREHGFTRLTERPSKITPEECKLLEKSVPDNIGICYQKGTTGYSLDDIQYELNVKLPNILRTIRDDRTNIDTVIFVMPQFSIKGYSDRDTNHLNGYRDLGKSRVLVPEKAQEGKSLSLVCEFTSSRNQSIVTTYTEVGVSRVAERKIEDKFYTLGRVFKMTEHFHTRLKENNGEIADLLKNIFIVSSSYYESDELSSLKALHVIMKGIYKVAGLPNTVPLKRWIESYRKQGAEVYLGNFLQTKLEERREIMRNVDNLKSVMTEYFRKLAPINFLLDDQEHILKKINDELTNCGNVKDVRSAYIDANGDFHVFTEHIYIKQPTEQTVIPGLSAGETEEMFGNLQNMFWDIGRLHITTRKDGIVTIVSNTRQIPGYHDNFVGHPHVIEENGKVCLGEISTIVFELINLHEYSSLAGLLINFAKSVNLEDAAGKTIKRWPQIQLNPS